MSDRVDTRTDIQALREYADPEVSMLGTVDMVVIEGIADRYESLAAERDDCNLLLDAAIEDKDYWEKRYHGMKERASKHLRERDTYRSAMQSAIALLDDGSPHKAHGVLDAALGEGEDHD